MKMGHVTELLSAYLDEQVSSGERARITTHLEACESCRAHLEMGPAGLTGLQVRGDSRPLAGAHLLIKIGGEQLCNVAHLHEPILLLPKATRRPPGPDRPAAGAATRGRG